jgi:epoxyqueuosine reductase
MAVLTSEILKHRAKAIGFSYCGVARAGFLEEEAPRLEQWLRNGQHGTMGYMERHFDKRLDPTLLVPGTKSVVSLLYNYFVPKPRQHEEGLKISTYAYGDDYHTVIREKLRALLGDLRAEFGDIQGRVFVDSAPLMEKAWAAKAGLGWVGKNANLITRRQGSFFFLAEMLLDVALEPDAPVGDYCGTCTACIDACPTGAIPAPYTVDGSRCISYFTIELREAIPEAFRDKLDDWIFGCDVCQDVCPWNRFSRPHAEARFAPNEGLLNTKRSEWLDMTEAVFEALTKTSAVSRPGLEHMKENVKATAGPR